MNGGTNLILKSPEGKVYEHVLFFKFYIINNEVEYKALFLGLKFAKGMGILNLQAYSDS